MASDEKEDQQGTMVDSAKVHQFLEAKGADCDCMVCGHDEWGLWHASQEGVVGGVLPPGRRDGHYLLSGGRPVLLMECQNCGFIRLHSYSKYLAWLKNRDAIAAQEGDNGGRRED